MTLGDKDCCSRPYCGHGEVYHDLRNGTHYGPCALCHSSQRNGCKGFAPPLVIGEKLVLIGQRFWFRFEKSDFKNDPVGWHDVKYIDTQGPRVVVVKLTKNGFDKWDLGREYEPGRWSFVKPQEASP